MYCFTVEVQIHSSHLSLVLLAFNYSLTVIKKGFILLNNLKKNPQEKPGITLKFISKIQLGQKQMLHSKCLFSLVTLQPLFFNIPSYNRNAPLIISYLDFPYFCKAVTLLDHFSPETKQRMTLTSTEQNSISPAMHHSQLGVRNTMRKISMCRAHTHLSCNVDI